MSDIKLNITIKEENNILFKRCIRKLLNSTFIIGDKDEKLYSFISREANRQDVSDYLRMIGFDILIDTNVRIVMLKPYEADEEVVGLKRANIVTFSPEQYHLLLVLWEIYLENIGYSNENIVMLGDLIDKIKAYEVDMDSNKLSAAMKIFKKYELIDYNPTDKTEDAIITLYPSLQFGWDVAQFKTVSAEYMRNKQIDNSLSENNLDSDKNEEDME